MRDKLKESGFIVGSNPVVLESEKTPTSELLNVLFLVLSVIMALAAIIPFFKRNKWPKEKELEEMEHPEMLAAMHPGLHVPADLLPSLAAGLPNATDPSQPEVVLLKINCWNNAKHPSFAVVTNKRYLLYRTNLQLGLSILKGIAKLIDKIPVFGSFVSMLVEPFIESYEIVLSPELPRFHKNMDHDHHEILSGNVHWHKHCDVALADIPKMAKALSIKRSGWSGLARVVFLPHSLKGIFATPKDFIIPEYCEFVVLHKLLELFGPTFALHGCTVTKEKHKIEISWPKA